MLQEQLKPTFTTTADGLEVRFLDSEGEAIFKYLVDADRKAMIADLNWYRGKKYPVTQPTPHTKPMAFHRLLAGVISNSECVVHKNGNRADCRRANLDIVPKSFVARTANKCIKRGGRVATAHKGVYREQNGTFYSGHSYRFNIVESPRYKDIQTAVLAQAHIAWLLEPRMQPKIPEPQIPVELANELRPVIMARKDAIDQKEHPPATPIPNIYLSAPWPNESYEYSFTHEGARYRKAGFKSIIAALKAYNRRVMAVTNDPERRHQIPPEIALSESDRIKRLEDLGILKDGKSTGPIGRYRAITLCQELQNGN
jgi:hypothetical protein